MPRDVLIALKNSGRALEILLFHKSLQRKMLRKEKMAICKFCVNEIWRSAHIVYVEKMSRPLHADAKRRDGGLIERLADDPNLGQMPQFLTCPYAVPEPTVPWYERYNRYHRRETSPKTAIDSNFSAEDWYSSRPFGATIGS